MHFKGLEREGKLSLLEMSELRSYAVRNGTHTVIPIQETASVTEAKLITQKLCPVLCSLEQELKDVLLNDRCPRRTRHLWQWEGSSVRHLPHLCNTLPFVLYWLFLYG